MKLYLGVNEDGTEVASNIKMFKYKEYLKNYIKDYDMSLYFKNVNIDEKSDFWCDNFSQGYLSVPKFNGVELPKGQISNHYELKDWDLFKCKEVPYAPEWDGHTPQEAAKRLEEFIKR